VMFGAKAAERCIWAVGPQASQDVKARKELGLLMRMAPPEQIVDG
jgi:hypothetical protein